MYVLSEFMSMRAPLLVNQLWFIVPVNSWKNHASSAARVFYISLVFSNARRVLSQCNTWLRLLYLLNLYQVTSQVYRTQLFLDYMISVWIFEN